MRAKPFFIRLKMGRKIRLSLLVFGLIGALFVGLIFRVFTDFAFLNAVERSDIGAMRIWLKLGADINFRDVDKTPLHWAFQESNQKIIVTLLDLGADPNARWRDQNAATPLMAATSENWPEVVEKRLEKGARVRDTNSAGQTAADSARPGSRIAALLKHAQQTP